MEKVDFKKKLAHLYNPPSKEVTVVDVPEMRYLMIDGEGDPNTAQDYKQAVEALYAVSYTLKFMSKKMDAADYVVMPLEGLWWTPEGTHSLEEIQRSRDAWRWTSMIMQPETVTEERFGQARSQVMEKKGLPILDRMRLAPLHEGQAAQILHIGSFSEEGPNIERLHSFIEERGGKPAGKHHEIYLSDLTKTAPDKLRTVIRQPFR